MYLLHCCSGHGASGEATGPHSSLQHSQDWSGVCWRGTGQLCSSIVWQVSHTSCSHSQTSEAEILANTSGSSRFQEFLAGLGQLVRLADCLPDQVYLGGLDRGGGDGEYAYLYQDDTTQGQAVSMQPLSL